MTTHEVDLERMLRDVAVRIEWPASPHLAPRVRARLEAGPVAAPSWWERLRTLVAQPAFAVTAAVVIFCAALTASESARVAVADFLGLDGVRIEFTKKLPEDVGTVLILGERVTLTEATERAGFDVQVPSGDFAVPDRVFFDTRIGEGQVSLVYAPRPGLPAANENVGMLVMQYEVTLEEAYYKKLLQGTNTIQEVRVDSDFGFWVRGPHTIEFRDDGTIGHDEARLAGNTLLWERDGVTIRLESALSKSRALRIAESMQ